MSSLQSRQVWGRSRTPRQSVHEVTYLLQGGIDRNSRRAWTQKPFGISLYLPSGRCLFTHLAQ
jgi:hypothetical protein